jgi:outer membrane receptor protein involved in Fe transport
MVDATITRIATIVPGNTLIYNIFQNADKSSATGIEAFMQQEFTKSFTANLSGALYRNINGAFSINNQYPVPTTYSMEEASITSGNLKANAFFKLAGKTDLQFTAIWLAPDIIPQGKIASRFSIDLGVKKQIQKGKGELYLNATDLFNTLVLEKEIIGNGFTLRSTDYLETQVVRLGYSYKF